MSSTVFGLKVYMASALGLSVWSERVAGVGFVDRSKTGIREHRAFRAKRLGPEPSILIHRAFKYPHKKTTHNHPYEVFLIEPI